MKKLVFVLAIGAIGFLSSCKKDYTCKCRVSGDVIEKEITDAKEEDAEDKCDRYEDEFYKSDPEADCDLLD